jgi:thymidine kinase
MKSGKSLELIARVAPYEFANQEVLYIQPEANVRDKGIVSRIGINTTAITVKSLRDITPLFDVIGIDEIHMFNPKETPVIDSWIKEGKSVFVTGLDLDYRGKMPPIIANLLELKPDNLIFKIAVCDTCKKYDAPFTQILHNGEPVLTGLPVIVPEDGTYEYQARCRNCFVKK